MKVKKYCISVQWGEGMHYFNGYFEHLDLALIAAANKLKVFRQAKQRRVKPKIFVWEMKRNLIL